MGLFGQPPGGLRVPPDPLRDIFAKRKGAGVQDLIEILLSASFWAGSVWADPGSDPKHASNNGSAMANSHIRIETRCVIRCSSLMIDCRWNRK